jgi:hypothetical protein
MSNVRLFTMRPLTPTVALTLFFTLVGFVSGCGSAQFRIPGFGSMGAIAGGLLLSIATFTWFRADSFKRSFRRSATLDVAFVGLTVLVLPYYLIKSRGLNAGLKAIGAGLSIYVLNVLATVIGALFVGAVGT